MSSPEADVSYERRSSYSKFKPRRFTNSDDYRGEKSYNSQKYSQSSRDDSRYQFNSSNYQGGGSRSFNKPMRPKFESNYRGGGGGERHDFKGRTNSYNNYKPYHHRSYNDNNNRKRDDYPPSSSRTKHHHRDNEDFDNRNPDDDPRATRTLFVGNIDTSCTASELRKVFDRYGVIEEIDVKRPSHPYGGTYAFIKFKHMDVAHKAKSSMSDQVIGRSICKIGYGKSVPSTRLWVGRLGHWVSLEELTREFDRFGAIRHIEYEKGNDCGYVLYDSLDAAAVALREMKGFIFSGSPQKIQIDFASTEEKTGNDDSNSFSSSNKYSRNYCPESRMHAAEGSRKPRDDDYQSMNKPDRMYRRNDWQDNPRGNHYDKDSNREGHDRPSSKPRRKRSLSPHEYPSDSSSHQKSKHSTRRSSQHNSNPKRRRSNSNNSSPLGDNVQGSNSDLSDNEENVKRNGNSNNDENKDSESKDSKTENLLDVSKRFPVAWRGTFALRNSVFPVRMHLIGGNPELADCFLKPGSAPGAAIKELSITQRLRLDQPKLDEVSRRISTAGASGHCILLALPAAHQGEDSDSSSKSQSRPLRSLVTYFKQKQAAGVIPIPAVAAESSSKEEAGILHAFPPCDYSHQQLLKVAPNLGAEPSKEDHLVVVLVRGV